MLNSHPRRMDGHVARHQARIAGALYLIIIIIGVCCETLIRNRLVVYGDAAATAHNILGNENLWRIGIGAQAFLLMCAIALTHYWYQLLRPVSEKLAQSAVLFGIVSLAIEGVSVLHLQATLVPLSMAEFATATDRHVLYDMAYLSVIAHTHTFALALIVFGGECLIGGYLIYRSGYLPRAIGVLMQLAGASYIVTYFSMMLYPPLASTLLPASLLPPFIGESSFCLWLLFKGVNVDAWNRRAFIATELPHPASPAGFVQPVQVS